MCDYEIRIEKIKNGLWKKRKVNKNIYKNYIRIVTIWELVCDDTSLHRNCFLECSAGTPAGYFFSSGDMHSIT